MAVPRKKMSKSRIGMRRSGHKMATVTWVEDKKSGELRHETLSYRRKPL